MMQAEDISPTDVPSTLNNRSWINNDAKQAISKRRRAYGAKMRSDNEETIAAYIELADKYKELSSRKNEIMN